MVDEKKILEALKELDRTPVEDRACAICDSVCNRIGPNEPWHSIRVALEVLFEEWPEFSGDSTYPVPSCQEGQGWRSAFEYAEYFKLIWKGEYGAARQRLLTFCIKTLEDRMEARAIMREAQKRMLDSCIETLERGLENDT